MKYFEASGAKVITVAEATSIITAGASLRIQPDYTFSEMPKADILVIPGGAVDENNPAILNWLKEQNNKTEKILSISNGAFFLSSAGLLDGLEATTFYGLISSLSAISPKTRVVDDKRYVDNGHIVTSAGLSSGIDAALLLVSQYLGIGRARQIAINLEYDWNYENGFVRGKLADKHLHSLMDVFYPFERKTIKYDGTEREWKAVTQIKTELTPQQLLNLLSVQATKVHQ